MKAILIPVWVVATVVALSSTIAQGATAEQSFAKGKTLLAKGDFDGALQNFTAAVRADRENEKYTRNYTIVRRVIALRSRLDAEQDPQRWEYMARALHSFYTNERIYPETLSLGEKMHAKLDTASTARMLAETQLAMDKNADAAKILAALSPDKRTPTTQALYGIALVRQADVAKARQIANALTVPDTAGPRMRYCAARLQAAVGNSDQALVVLKGCFQHVPPSLLDGYKSHAKQCAEFAKLLDTPRFADVLKTKSDVAESKCSGGSKCAGCPNRGNCSKPKQ